MEETESKCVNEMDISVNTSEVKDTNYEEHVVTDIEVIKATVYFRLFDSGKELCNNLYVMYERA